MDESTSPVPAVRFVHPPNLPPALAANYFYFGYLGTDVELLVGFLDIPRVLEQNEDARASGATEISFGPEIVARLVMSQQAFAVFKSQLEDIAKRMQAGQTTQKDGV
jgi:hypothetical protein